MYVIELHSTRAFSWTRMRKVRQYYSVIKAPNGELIYASELVHNRDDMWNTMNNLVKGIEAKKCKTVNKINE